MGPSWYVRCTCGAGDFQGERNDATRLAGADCVPGRVRWAHAESLGSVRPGEDGPQAEAGARDEHGGDGALCRGERAVDDGGAEATRSGAGQGGPARHGPQDHRDRARREVQRVDVRRPGARTDGPRARRGPHPVHDDESHRRARARRQPDGRADDALDGLSRRDGVAAGQVPVDRAGADDRVRVHAELPGRVHVPLRNADDPRAHRLGDVWRGRRRAARRLPDEGRSRVRHRPE